LLGQCILVSHSHSGNHALNNKGTAKFGVTSKQALEPNRY
jgi:hypothetical protein